MQRRSMRLNQSHSTRRRSLLRIRSLPHSLQCNIPSSSLLSPTVRRSMHLKRTRHRQLFRNSKAMVIQRSISNFNMRRHPVTLKPPNPTLHNILDFHSQFQLNILLFLSSLLLPMLLGANTRSV